MALVVSDVCLPGLIENMTENSSTRYQTSKRSQKPKVDPVNIRIGTLNVETLLCDITQANYVQAVRDLKIYLLEVQGVRRAGDGTIKFEDELEGWKFVYHGQKCSGNYGVGFICSPEVEIVEVHPHWNGRILSIRAKVHDMRIAATTIYAPTEVATPSSKATFYCELRKAQAEMDKFKQLKSLLLGDFNSTIGHESKVSGGWDDCLGWNNSSLKRHTTNNNGEFLLQHAKSYKFLIWHSHFKSKRIHQST